MEDLREEGTYARYRADQLRWQLQQGRLFRRQLLQLFGAASAALTLGGRLSSRAWADHVTVVKPTPAELFINHRGSHVQEETGEATVQRRAARRRGGRRRFVAVLGVLSIALSTIAASALPVRADVIEDPGDGDGGGGGGSDSDPPFTPPANGFDWAMKDRFGVYRDGIIDYHWNQAAPAPLRWGSSNADREKYDPAHVHASGFEVNFYACPTQAEDDASQLQPSQTANTYHWVIAGQPLAPARSCRLTHSFPSQGPYHVRLTIAGPNAAGLFN
ncbi:MAG: hypothetical protein M3144_00375, partial [Actinomycetota bacterium]|nr:hypothetical protein [Actinomycetota bacterium]